MPASPEQPRRPRGRPSSYRPELARVICLGLAEGIPLAEICRQQGMPSRRTVIAWAHRHPDFAAKYERARDLGADVVGDRLASAYRRLGGALRNGRKSCPAAAAELKELDRLQRVWVTRRRIPVVVIAGYVDVNGKPVSGGGDREA